MKDFIRSLFHAIGYDITRFNLAHSEDFRMRYLLRQLQIDLILDVGANTGQSGRYYRRLGYKGTLVSFEPLPEAHQALLHASQSDPHWHVAPRMAIGERQGEIEINVAGNTLSSSLLPMHALHAEADPDSRYVGTERVLLQTLDEAARDYTLHARATFLKLDVQGYEAQVLKGAQETLPTVAALQSELSLAALYEGQPTWQEMIATLADMGFGIYALLPGFCDPHTGRLLQMDGLFVRESLRAV